MKEKKFPEKVKDHSFYSSDFILLFWDYMWILSFLLAFQTTGLFVYAATGLFVYAATFI